MYANIIKYFFRKLINLERKDNFNLPKSTLNIWIDFSTSQQLPLTLYVNILFESTTKYSTSRWIYNNTCTDSDNNYNIALCKH